MAQNWWALAVRGIAAIFLGLLAFSWPGLTLALLTALFGVYCLLDGVFSLLSAIMRWNKRAGMVNARRPWVSVVVGLISIVAGTITFRAPVLTALILAYVIAFWTFTRGVVEVGAALDLPEGVPGRGILAFGGIISILFGAYAAFWPVLASLAIVALVASYTLLYGLTLLVFSFRLKDQPLEAVEEQHPRRAA